MKRNTFFLLFIVCSLFGLPALFAQNNSVVSPQNADAGTNGESTAEPTVVETKQVALVPFHGSQTDLIAVFGEVLQNAVKVVDGAKYTPVIINMTNLPADVPEGGFPPYVCPSPSLVGDVPFAMTGELYLGENNATHLRLYLWEMLNGRLLCSDELVAADREECETYLPPLLDWLFSWIKDEEITETIFEPPEEKWMYIGLRAGSSFRFYSRSPAYPFTDESVSHYYNVNAAFQSSFQIFSFLSLQGEVVFTTEYAPYKTYDLESDDRGSTFLLRTDPITSYSLMLPVVVKGTLRRGPLFAAILGGVYAVVPLGEMENEKLGGKFAYALTLPVGYTAGINVGLKIGPGVLFMDIRWASDLGETVKISGEPVYKRNMISLSLGYEFGLFTKKQKEQNTSEQITSN